MLQNDVVFGSRWPVGEETLWTIVNLADRNVTGPQLRLGAVAGSGTMRYYDCYHGVELTPKPSTVDWDASSAIEVLSFPIEALGFGCVFATPHTPSANLTSFLAEMATMTTRPLASFSKQWKVLLQTIDPIAKITGNASEPHPAPAGMIRVPSTARYEWSSMGVEIEGGKPGVSESAEVVDVQYEWETRPMKNHSRTLTMPSFFIDQHLVTCGAYDRYLTGSGYVPENMHNFLRNWNRSGAVDGSRRPTLEGTGLEQVPVTYLSFAEAVSYCKALGKRLPSTIEWQYASQGTTGRQYPWGNADDIKCRPELESNRTIPGAKAVDTVYPKNCSSVFGLTDLVGNVWQYTSSFTDEHTRRVVLKGGSNYKPMYVKGSPHFNQNKADFYYPQARQLNQHNTYFLMSGAEPGRGGDGFERAGTLGFRCVRDIAAEPNAR
jgi:iron(II)-dependent oxidoreductase